MAVRAVHVTALMGLVVESELDPEQPHPELVAGRVCLASNSGESAAAR